MPSLPKRSAAAVRGKRGLRTRFLKTYTSDDVYAALTVIADREGTSVSYVSHRLLAEATGQAPYKRALR